MKCCLCGKSYEQEKIEPILIELNGEKTKVKTLDYKGQKINLCHQCLKTTLFYLSFIERYDVRILFEEDE